MIRSFDLRLVKVKLFGDVRMKDNINILIYIHNMTKDTRDEFQLGRVAYDGPPGFPIFIKDD